MGRKETVGNFPVSESDRRFMLIQLARHIIERVGGTCRNVRYFPLAY